MRHHLIWLGNKPQNYTQISLSKVKEKSVLDNEVKLPQCYCHCIMSLLCNLGMKINILLNKQKLTKVKKRDRQIWSLEEREATDLSLTFGHLLLGMADPKVKQLLSQSYSLSPPRLRCTACSKAGSAMWWATDTPEIRL